jgi:hypothetical protein
VRHPTRRGAPAHLVQTSFFAFCWSVFFAPGVMSGARANSRCPIRAVTLLVEPAPEPAGTTPGVRRSGPPTVAARLRDPVQTSTAPQGAARGPLEECTAPLHSVGGRGTSFAHLRSSEPQYPNIPQYTPLYPNIPLYTQYTPIYPNTPIPQSKILCPESSSVNKRSILSH